MKFLPPFLILLFTIRLASADPVVQVHWAFEKEMPLQLDPAARANYSYTPARVLDLSFPLDREETTTQMKGIPFPTGYERPSAPSKEGLITPSTPYGFDTQNLGYKLVLEATHDGSYIRLIGSLLIRTGVSQQSIFGEESGPIYLDPKTKGVLVTAPSGDKAAGKLPPKKGLELLSPNVGNMVRLKTAESNFQVNALPGKTYTLNLTGPDGPVKATVRCALEP